jgi:hypothetical protein
VDGHVAGRDLWPQGTNDLMDSEQAVAAQTFDSGRRTIPPALRAAGATQAASREDTDGDEEGDG